MSTEQATASRVDRRAAAARAPLAARLGEWSRERFPVAYGVLCVALFGAAVLYARSHVVDGAVPFSPVDALGFFAAWAYFLLLRVLDEHKDFESDGILHPGRPVQRGVVSLGELRVLAVLGIAMQLGASLAYDGGVGPVTLRWIALMVWTFLMAKEFFAVRWLRERLLLYAVSHMLCMPLAILWLAQMGAGSAAPSRGVYAQAVVAFLLGFVFEIARKTFTPEDERQGVDSYSKVWGTRGAPMVMLLLLGAALVTTTMMIAGFASGWAAWASVAALGFAMWYPTGAAFSFVAFPTSRGARAVEKAAGTAMLLAYLVLGLTVTLTRGMRWD